VAQREVSFSIAADAAWAPNIGTKEAWLGWANGDRVIEGGSEPSVASVPPMLRRRAGFLGKMALEVAYRCLNGKKDVPTIFCSRHGESARSVELLLDLSNGVPLSPTSFGLSVHNAIGGLFSIARGDRANHTAIAGGNSTIEHGVIEACSLLAEQEPAVLLVAYDCPLPDVYSSFQDCREQPYAWAWLLKPPLEERFSLAWSAAAECAPRTIERPPPGLDILRFYLRNEAVLERISDGHRWLWTRHA
jgi:Beta-ketoacyl synthase, N-terminal domain